MRVKEKTGTIDWAIKNIFDAVSYPSNHSVSYNSFRETGHFLLQSSKLNKNVYPKNKIEIVIIGNKYQKQITKSFVCIDNNILYDENKYFISKNEEIFHVFNANKILATLDLIQSSSKNEFRFQFQEVATYFDDLLASLKTTKNGDFGYKIKKDTFIDRFSQRLSYLGVAEITLNQDDYKRYRLTEFGIQSILELYAIFSTSQMIKKSEFDKRCGFIEGLTQPEDLCRNNPFNQKYWITNTFDRVLEAEATQRDCNHLNFLTMQEMSTFAPISFFDKFLKRSLKNNHIECLI